MDLVLNFESASQSLERSYTELQNRIKQLKEDLEKERSHRIRLERLAAMGEMAMELAHEIRNPLASIELYASMMDGDFAEQIVRSVKLLNHSMTNVLQFGQPIVPSPKRTSVEDLLEGTRAVLQPLAAQKRIQLETGCEPNATVVADSELIHRMLLNLGLNALRETPSGGRIRLTGKLTQDADAAGSGVLLLVEDTGPGIPQDVLPRIFDARFSTRRGGNGLGLAIVKRIVDSHGGKIQVESSKYGTRFLITLPHNTEVVSEQLSAG